MKSSLLPTVSVCVLCVLSACGGGSGNSGGAGGGGGSPMPTVALSSSSTTVTWGQPVTLSWSSTNATSCIASASPSENDWSGSEGMSGSLSVTPASVGTVTYTLLCTGAAGSAPNSVSVTANPNPNFVINPGPLPPGIVGKAYGTSGGRYSGQYFLLTASGGTGALTWSWNAASGSSLPPGLSCCDLFFRGQNQVPVHIPGAIYGEPSAVGTYHVVVTAKDSGTLAAITRANFEIDVNYPPPPVISTVPSPAIGTLNSPYVGFTFTATEGSPPLTWSETGKLPTGLGFNSGGTLSGKPTEAGTFNITIMVQDSLGRNSVPQIFNIQVLSTGFTPTGTMATARDWHTATLLNNGKVLIAGGASTTVDLATAELFDPTAGSFSPTGSLQSTRVSHTATLLSDGKVLITGGYGGGATFATAEIFDPASGSLTPTGSMETSRYWHTATLLSNGKVLVTGGLDASQNLLASAEIFDPTTGAFTPTGSMGTARMFHTATLLNNGNVLVTGGGNATAELFDPTTGSFSPTGSMESVRTSHAATLENGKVLVTGGTDGGGKALATAEIFDPATGTFATIGSTGTARYFHTATLLSDGKVLVVGGLANASTPLSAAELFDPSSGTFSATVDMSAARASHTATLLTNGEVLVTGGQGVDASFGTVLATAEIYQ